MKPFQDIFDRPKTTPTMRPFTEAEGAIIKTLLHQYLKSHAPNRDRTRVPLGVVQMAGSMFVMGVAFAGAELRKK